MNKPYDVVIIGAGLGGLLSAVFLAKEGMHVAVVEQNKQIGGCLQTFSFDKKVFDSCVHYIGALAEGQTQHRIFDYAGILPELRFRRLDIDGFDRIIFGDEPEAYPQAQGFDNFRDQLLPFFPKDKIHLEDYNQLIQQVSSSFPLYKLNNGTGEEKRAVSGLELGATLKKILPDDRLRNVIAGNSLLYAGDPQKTPFYIHALVLQSYIESAWKCEGGSSRISKALGKKLREYGGDIFRNEKIVRLSDKDGVIKRAVASSGQVFEARNFIANAHPSTVMKWLDNTLIKPAYRNRIQAAPNSIAAFMINIVLRPGKVRYLNYNVYWNRSDNAFAAIAYRKDEGFPNYAIYFTEDKLHEGFAESVAILAYMHHEEAAAWNDTENRTAAPGKRGDAYEAFKEQKTEDLINLVANRFPEIKEYMQSYRSASPLTFRDYTGAPDGGMYGIFTNVHQPEVTRVPVRTKIPNLLLTGQNINLHGVLGVSVTAIATCGELLGLNYLIDKIKTQ